MTIFDIMILIILGLLFLVCLVVVILLLPQTIMLQIMELKETWRIFRARMFKERNHA